jgi:hypothetical protein
MSNDGQFWTAKLNANGQIEFYRGDSVEGAAYYHDKPELYKYLVLEGGAVHEVSQEQKDAIDTAEQQAIQDKIIQDEAERLRIIEEQERLAEEAANAPFEVSRMKLYEFFESIGAGDNFIAFIKSDPKKEFMWFSSTVLDTNHPVVVAAMESIASMLPEGVTGNDLLRQSRV